VADTLDYRTVVVAVAVGASFEEEELADYTTFGSHSPSPGRCDGVHYDEAEVPAAGVAEIREDRWRLAKSD